MIKLQRPPCPYPIALTKHKNYKHPRNKTALQESSFDKCIYCESLISHVYYGDVEHIIPKSKKPELKYDWDNLGYICAICNVSKSDKYDPDLEILNPYIEDPSQHLVAAGSMLYQKKGSEKGELTILDANLNRLELIQKRQDLLDRINRAIVACYKTSNASLRSAALAELKNEANPNKEYSFSIKQFLENQNV